MGLTIEQLKELHAKINAQIRKLEEESADCQKKPNEEKSE